MKHLEEYTKRIVEIRTKADALADDNPSALMQKIKLLAECQTYIGRVSSIMDGEYKRIYAQRKYEYALAEVNSKPPRQAHAELAVRELRIQESEAYQAMTRWRNAFNSTTEELHSLKLKMRIDFHDGSNLN